MTIVRRSLGVFGALVFFCSTSGSALPETIINKSVSYFTISGTTADELDRDLVRRGPKTTSSGLRHPGATQIKFGGAVTYVEKNGRCSVGSAKVTLKTHIILPQWKNRKRAQKDLSLIWDTLAGDIKRHEERHAEIARNHARDMEQTFLSLSPQRTCAAMQAAVAKASKNAVADHDRDQLRFDRIEAKNFEDRMIRLLRNRLGSQSATK